MKKTKNYLKYGIVFISLILIIMSSSCTKEEALKTTPTTDTQIQVKLSLSRAPVLGQTTEVIATITSASDIPNASAEIVLPKGFEVVNGELSWNGDLVKNEKVQLNTTVKVVEEGDWKIEAYASGQAETANVKGEDIIYTTTLVEKVPPSGEIYINMSEYCKGIHRTFDVGTDFVRTAGETIPEPRKGDDLNNYFKSLHITEDYVYVLMQFEDCDGDPINEQIQTLAADGITLFEYHGDHTYYAKVPKTVLETKSYDFVRWIGIRTPAGKLQSSLREKVWDKNCIGKIKLNIQFYENLNDKQVKQLSNLGYLVGPEIDVTKLEEIASLDFVKEIGVGEIVTSVLGGSDIKVSVQPDPFKNITCDNITSI